ncbi:MAG: P1 family peptidase [Armatimonadota bacterium]|nr:P1 family peptidase [Armatimonadota bacterium]MDR7438671.1 P1 family peptidase [Armatimonadota bacterium]MDR7563768.1 P1 family peptidase [Armatimonadota bacterium]MDR7567932.1 P1 family peptidase [Armatimonadota bacterium]MDR7601812.1 P1 family peptidase [Armatimonadota bacterium]
MPGLTEVEGIRVGHATDLAAATGCTVVLCQQGAVAGAEVRGFAPGTREVDLLRPLATVQEVHAVLLSGGSAFGLAAADGVVRYLEERGVGFETGVARVPIVPAAVIYDLALGRPDVRPGPEMGYRACEAATSGPVEEGSVGAGTGATVGKLLGPAGAMKGGVGSWSVRLAGDVVVGALMVVNAVGDVVAEDGTILAGTRDPRTGTFVGSRSLLERGVGFRPLGNTVIGVVATNARLDKIATNRLARLAHHGIGRAVSPSHTSLDGDTVFALATGTVEASYDAVAAAVPEVVAEAIRRAVRFARGLHGVPGLADGQRGNPV